MEFTDKTAATEWLIETVQPDTAPTLPSTAIDTALGQSRVVDSEGRAPVDDGYVETWNAFYAAALLLDMKSSMATVTKVGGVASFTSEGSSVTRTAGTSAAEFRSLADWYRSQAFPSGPVSVIDLGPALGPTPRSAFEGVTPDAHRY